MRMVTVSGMERRHPITPQSAPQKARERRTTTGCISIERPNTLGSMTLLTFGGAGGDGGRWDAKVGSKVWT